MTFARLRRADWVALVAALAVLLISATDWYSTAQGREARRIQEQTDSPGTGQQGEIDRQLNESARLAAEEEEQNAWQADAAVDRVLLLALLAAAAAAVAAAFLRAAGRRFEPPRTPSAVAAITALVAILLITYRVLQEPGGDAGTTVELGALLAIAVLGVLAVASARALRNEEEGEPFREAGQPEPAPS